VTLSTKVVDFVWLYRAKDPVDRTGIVKIAVMKKKPDIFLMGIAIDMINPAGIE
jgi:hypothetical protein